MGKIQKMVWPQGKNLKPQPKGRAPVQPIPCPPPRSAAERRRKVEYRLAISKGLYPSERDPLRPLSVPPSELPSCKAVTFSTDRSATADPFKDPWLLRWVAATMMMPGEVSSTFTINSERTGSRTITREDLERLLSTPVPSREPIEVTEAQYQALQELPVAETPHEAMTLACIYGTAVLVVKAVPAP